MSISVLLIVIACVFAGLVFWMNVLSPSSGITTQKSNVDILTAVITSNTVH